MESGLVSEDTGTSLDERRQMGLEAATKEYGKDRMGVSDGVSERVRGFGDST